MPPQLALILCIFLILYLFILDFKRKSNVSSALWIPLIWIMITGSRFVSQWLNLGVPLESEYHDGLSGTPLDRNVFLILIIAGLFILSRRKIQWPQILKSNIWLFLLLFYCGISTIWSDYTFISLKRWIKFLGIFVMVLVVLTESDPVNAVRTIIRRCAYVLVPLSVLFIKYYPAIGRNYGLDGTAFYGGVTTNKNSLGMLCLVCGIYFFWNLLTMWRKRNTYVDKKEVFIHIILLIMILWLFRKVDSATSLICFISGAFILVWIELPMIKRNVKVIGAIVFINALVFLALLLLSGSTQFFVSSVGRDMTLTGRVDFWKDLIEVVTNPLLGTGFESFWFGDRAEELARYWGNLNQAHNGYLEIYLNIGWIGIFFLVAVIIAAYQKIIRTFLIDYDYGKFQLAFLVIVLLYNVTEGAFHGISLMKFIFILVAMESSSFLPFQIQGSTQK